MKLGDGESVVFFTDGLIETRGEDLHVGLARLAGAALGVRDQSAQDAAASLAAANASPPRLDAVRRTNLLDSAPEESFDRLTDAAASLLGTEYAFVTIVDERRSYWKSCRGVDAVAVEDRQNPVEESFCQYVVGLDDGFGVRDARLDPRTRDNPSVEAMGVIAWAGEPIRSRDGPVLGSFCVLGSEPRGGHSRRLAGEHRARPAVRAVPSRVARSGAP